MEKLDNYQVLELKFKQQCIDAPHLVVSEVYSLGIKACEEKDTLKARNVVKTLIGALNFEYEETAIGLYRLYGHCLSMLNDGDFDGTKNILFELNKYWDKAIETNLADKTEAKSKSENGAAISELYDRGIKACEAQECTMVEKILRVLMDSLDFRYEEVSSGFYRLYEYALSLVKDKKFDDAKEILVELHQCWNKALVANVKGAAA